jgi:hypothetical protein
VVERDDDDGPFLGLGASYFTALWRYMYDRPRLESDLESFFRVVDSGNVPVGFQTSV